MVVRASFCDLLRLCNLLFTSAYLKKCLFEGEIPTLSKLQGITRKCLGVETARHKKVVGQQAAHIKCDPVPSTTASPNAEVRKDAPQSNFDSPKNMFDARTKKGYS